MNIYLILRFLLLFSSFNFTCCLNNVLFFASFHFKSIYIYIFSFKILITCNQSIKKKKLSSIINQRNNFLKWKKIVTTRQRIRGIIPPHHSNFATSLTGDTRIVRVARYRYSSCNVSQSGGSVAKCSVFAWGNGTSFQKNWDISFGDSRRGEKEIYFFFLNAFAKATEIDRVGVPLEYRNCRKRIIRAARWMKKLSSFYLSFEVPVQMARRERNGGGWKCSMKFIFAVRRKWKKSFDPRCVKFSYADGIFQHYWFNIGTLWMNVAVRVVHLYVKLVAVFPFFGEI